MLVKTSGLIYDDRVRKEALSLKRFGCDIRIVAVEDANASSEDVLWDGVPVTTVSLATRRLFASRKGLVFHLLEMYTRFAKVLWQARPDIIWLHDRATVGLIPVAMLFRGLGFAKRIIWDQHELPPEWALQSPVGRHLLTWAMNGCDGLLVASPERCEYLQSKLEGLLRRELHVIQNLPDTTYTSIPRLPLPLRVAAWLDGSPYVLAQGGAAPGRNLENLIIAIRKVGGAKLVVVGSHSTGRIEQLRNQLGDEITDYVLFVGAIPQLELPPFVDHAMASAVFYSRTTMNNRLCAPNRLFQAVARGVPVIVGKNPPMVQFVEKYGCGVVVDDESPDSIAEGIHKITRNHGEYRERARRAAPNLVWERQEMILQSVCDAQRRCSYGEEKQWS